MKKIKEIYFRYEACGYGIINYDSNDQKYQLRGKKEKPAFKKFEPHVGANKNVSFAKKVIYEDDYKIKVSRECILNGMFGLGTNGSIGYNTFLLKEYLGNIDFYLRGNLIETGKGGEITRNSSKITFPYAEQCGGSESTVDVGGHEGQKDSKNKASDKQHTSDTSFYHKEKIGDIKYKSGFSGVISLNELQFVPLDDINGRKRFNPDYFDEVKENLKYEIPSFDSKLAYYKKIANENTLPEYGFVFSDEDIKTMLKYFFRKMLNTRIRKAGSKFDITRVYISVSYDGEISTEENRKWEEINLENIFRDVEFKRYYEEISDEEAEKYKIKIK